MVDYMAAIDSALAAPAYGPLPNWTAATLHLRSRIAQACLNHEKMCAMNKIIESTCGYTCPEFRPEKEFIAIYDYCITHNLPTLTIDELNGFGITDGVW